MFLVIENQLVSLFSYNIFNIQFICDIMCNYIRCDDPSTITHKRETKKIPFRDANRNKSSRHDIPSSFTT